MPSNDHKAFCSSSVLVLIRELRDFNISVDLLPFAVTNNCVLQPLRDLGTNDVRDPLVIEQRDDFFVVEPAIRPKEAYVG